MLHQLILDRKPEAVVQIGTFIGYSAAIIADALCINDFGTLICIDPEIPHRSQGNPVDIAREFHSALSLDSRISYVTGWSSGSVPSAFDSEAKPQDLGDEKSKQIPVIGHSYPHSLSKGVDFAFIHGDHSTGSTIMDFHLVREYLNVGATALFHDAYSWPTVAQTISIIWSDILYRETPTSQYYDLDVRQGWDGLAILRRKC